MSAWTMKSEDGTVIGRIDANDVANEHGEHRDWAALCELCPTVFTGALGDCISFLSRHLWQVHEVS